MCFYENYNISVISHFQRISLCLSKICKRIQSQLQTKTKAKEDDLLTQFFRKLKKVVWTYANASEENSEFNLRTYIRKCSCISKKLVKRRWRRRVLLSFLFVILRLLGHVKSFSLCFTALIFLLNRIKDFLELPQNKAKFTKAKSKSHHQTLYNLESSQH